MHLHDVKYGETYLETARGCLGVVVTNDPSDGASLLFEPLGKDGDIMGGDIFRTEASNLVPYNQRSEPTFKGKESTTKAAHSNDFESGPIPPYYAKVIDVGPEGETTSPSVMPTHVAMSLLGVAPNIGYAPTDYRPSDCRAIIINHLGGTTIITFNETGAVAETITPE